jgi:putative oxidoreductase
MKVAAQIPSILLAIVFIVFGLNFFLNFIPMPPLEGLNKKFFEVMAMESNYMMIIKVLEIVIGLMLLLPKTRALGLLLIAPIAVNILIYEVVIAHQPGIGVLLVVLVAAGIYFNREKYLSIVA